MSIQNHRNPRLAASAEAPAAARRTKRRNGEQTRQRLLKVALKQFVERGYAEASVRKIVAASDLSKPALCWHFGNKAGLYRAVLSWIEAELLQLITEAKAKSSDWRVQLVAVCAAVLEMASRNPQGTRLALSPTPAGGGAVPRTQSSTKACALFEAIRDHIGEGLTRGILDRNFQAQHLALAFFGALHIQTMASLAGAQPPSAAQAAELTVTLFLQGAGAKPVSGR